MGYGFFVLIGVQLVYCDVLVINVVGEVLWLMNMQEMGIVVQYCLLVKQFILNNECFGMVCQWQELLYGECYSLFWFEVLFDFVKLVEVFGVKGIICKDFVDFDDVIMEMIKYDGLVIFDCFVEKYENCFLMILLGKLYNEMLFVVDVEVFKEGGVFV